MNYETIIKIIENINRLTEEDIKDKNKIYFSHKTGNLLKKPRNRKDFTIKIGDIFDSYEKQKCIKMIKEEWAYEESLVGLNDEEQEYAKIDKILSDESYMSEREIRILKRFELKLKLDKIKKIQM